MRSVRGVGRKENGVDRRRKRRIVDDEGDKGAPLVRFPVARRADPCAVSILVAGREIARVKLRDSQGRALPQWRGCRKLGDDELFLVNADVPDSLDGRYFGPFPKHAIVGLAHPIWIDRAEDGRP